MIFKYIYFRFYLVYEKRVKAPVSFSVTTLAVMQFLTIVDILFLISHFTHINPPEIPIRLLQGIWTVIAAVLICYNFFVLAFGRKINYYHNLFKDLAENKVRFRGLLIIAYYVLILAIFIIMLLD